MYKGYINWDTFNLNDEIERGCFLITKTPHQYLFSESPGKDSDAIVFEPTTASENALDDEMRSASKTPKKVQIDEVLEDPKVAPLYAQKTDLHLWSRILKLMGGEYFQMAHIDREIYEERVAEELNWNSRS